MGHQWECQGRPDNQVEDALRHCTPDIPFDLQRRAGADASDEGVYIEPGYEGRRIGGSLYWLVELGQYRDGWSHLGLVAPIC